jgi:hypothetical protein
MKTEDDQIGKTRMLRAAIAIIIRGGPMVVNRDYHDLFTE